MYDISGRIEAVLMPVGVTLGIPQDSLVSGKAPATGMLTINLLQLHFAHNRPHCIANNCFEMGQPLLQLRKDEG